MKHLLQSYLTELRSGHQDYTTEHYCFRQFVKADAHPLFAASQNPQFIDILPARKGTQRNMPIHSPVGLSTMDDVTDVLSNSSDSKPSSRTIAPSTSAGLDQSR